MQIGSTNINPDDYRHKKLSELKPEEYAMAMEAMKRSEFWNPEWENQKAEELGIVLPKIAHQNEKGEDADPEPPSSLFNFMLILNGRKFKVMLDNLLRINTEEDLSNVSEKKLIDILQKCSAYRVTCFCAYAAAHREYRKWKMWYDEWLSTKREEARQQLRAERLADKVAGLRKELGQFTMQELDDYIIRKYTSDNRKHKDIVEEWEDHEKMFLELRDTLKDRAMHLQTLLRWTSDHTAPMKSSGDQI